MTATSHFKERHIAPASSPHDSRCYGKTCQENAKNQLVNKLWLRGGRVSTCQLPISCVSISCGTSAILSLLPCGVHDCVWLTVCIEQCCVRCCSPARMDGWMVTRGSLLPVREVGAIEISKSPGMWRHLWNTGSDIRRSWASSGCLLPGLLIHNARLSPGLFGVQGSCSILLQKVRDAQGFLGRCTCHMGYGKPRRLLCSGMLLSPKF